jgi:hypothetical protein
MSELCSSVRTLEEATHRAEKENSHFRETVTQIINDANNNNIGGNRNSVSTDGGGDRRSMYNDSFLDVPEEDLDVDLEFVDTYPSSPTPNKNKNKNIDNFNNQNQNNQQPQKIQR